MSTNPSQPELKWNRYDVIVAALVALLAVAVALGVYLPGMRSRATAVGLSAGGQETERVRLSDFSGTTATCNGYTLQIDADGDGVWVSHSDCPTQDCVHTGHITRAGQSIVCLPAQIIIHLEGAANDGPDVIVG